MLSVYVEYMHACISFIVQTAAQPASSTNLPFSDAADIAHSVVVVITTAVVVHLKNSYKICKIIEWISF